MSLCNIQWPSWMFIKNWGRKPLEQCTGAVANSVLPTHSPSRNKKDCAACLKKPWVPRKCNGQSSDQPYSPELISWRSPIMHTLCRCYAGGPLSQHREHTVTPRVFTYYYKTNISRYTFVKIP